MKFSIRDLLLVTVIVALAVGWWVEHSSLVKERLKSKAWKMYSEAVEANKIDRREAEELIRRMPIP